MDSKKKTCHRSGKTIYPADKQINFGGFDFLATHFTCKSTGTRLNLKTATVIEGEVYLRGEVGACCRFARRAGATASHSLHVLPHVLVEPR